MKTRKLIFALVGLITLTGCGKNSSSSSSGDGDSSEVSSDTSTSQVTPDETLLEAKKNAKGEVDGYLKNFVYPQKKYTPGTAVQTAVDNIVKDAKADIDKATAVSSLAGIVSVALDAIEKQYRSEIHFAAEHLTFTPTPLAISEDEWVTVPGMSDSKTYWSNVNWNLRGDDLLQALKTEMRKTFTQVTYSGALDAAKEMDKDPAKSSNILSLYDLKSQPAAGYNGGKWNREHTFPQSKLYENGERAAAAAPGLKNIASDVANIFACDADLNTERSNNSYGTWNYDDDPATYYKRLQINTSGQLTDNILYYGLYSPTPMVRGEIARAQLYMLVNWAGDVTRDSNFTIDTMIQWDQDHAPIKERDGQRQDGIYKYQDIRNPFIDNRKVACYIWSDVNTKTRKLCEGVV